MHRERETKQPEQATIALEANASDASAVWHDSQIAASATQ